MAISVKLSTGLRNHIASVGSAMSALQNGFIDIYAGTEPASPDDSATSATKLVRLSVDSTGAGLVLELVGTGSVGKPVAAVWSGVNLATGEATWFRHVAAGDDSAASAVQPRIQGNVGLLDAAMILTSTALGQDATQSLDAYTVTVPAASA